MNEACDRCGPGVLADLLVSGGEPGTHAKRLPAGSFCYTRETQRES